MVLFLQITAAVAVVQAPILAFAGKWLTARIEGAIKHEYDKQLESIQAEQRARERAAIVAELFSTWVAAGSTPNSVQKQQLNKLAWEAVLWLPQDLATEVNKRLSNDPTAQDIRKILLDVRQHLVGDHQMAFGDIPTF